MKTCTVPGCGRPVHGRGMCTKHYADWERLTHPEKHAGRCAKWFRTKGGPVRRAAVKRAAAEFKQKYGFGYYVAHKPGTRVRVGSAGLPGTIWGLSRGRALNTVYPVRLDDGLGTCHYNVCDIRFLNLDRGLLEKWHEERVKSDAEVLSSDRGYRPIKRSYAKR